MDFTPAQDGLVFTYAGARFASDVAVTGTMTLTFGTGPWQSRLWTSNITLTGPGGGTGTLVITYSGSGQAHIDGTINGHKVSLLD